MPDGHVEPSARARCAAMVIHSRAGARAATDNTGRYSFTTVRPAPSNEAKLPFFAIAVFARGLTNRLLHPRLPVPPRRTPSPADPLLELTLSERRRT
jgi:protocatechuate 3,4-dioxygenase alpha subunit